MRVRTDGEVVVAAAEVVALQVVVVIRGEQVLVDGDGDGLLCARGEQAGLAVAGELDACLFYHVFLFIFAVRGLCIHLHGVFAGNGAGILDVDFHHDVVAVGVDALDLLLKGRVREAVAEGIRNFILVLPFAGAEGSAHAAGSVLVAVAGDYVGIAGLIVTVADVDVLHLDGDERDLFVCGDLAAEGAGAAADDFIRFHIGRQAGVGEEGGIRARIDHRGSGEGILGIGIDQLARRVGGAAEDLSHARQAVTAGVAHHEDGVYLVFHLIRLHGVAARVEHEDDLVELAAVGDEVDHLFLVLEQRQGADYLAGGVVCHRHGVVGAFGALSADDDDGCVVIIAHVCHLLLIELDAVLVVAGAAPRTGGRTTGDGIAGDRVRSRGERVPDGRVDFDVLFRQRVLQVDGDVFADPGAGAAVRPDGVLGAVAEGRHLEPLAQRQGVVLVIQQGRAFAHLVLILILQKFDHLFQVFLFGEVAESRLVVLEVGIGIDVVIDELAVFQAERVVDGRCVRVADAGGDQHDHQQDRKQRRQAFPKFCVL